MALKPQYLAIAERKWHQLCSSIPPEWRLPDRYIPHGMRLSPIDSIHQIDEYKKDTGHLFDVPRDCGLLSEKEIKITEGFDVRGLLSEIHSGNLKAKEVVTAFCKRAAIAQQLTRCLSEPLFTSALEYAQQLDDHLQRTGRVVGPLHGLPVTVKDSFNIAGVDSAVGITALAFRPATSDAPLVQLLRSLGAVIIAKTNVPQTMGFLDTVNHLAGRTLNPRNRRLTAGGSSGGEAVAVAMRASMVGFGTDLGGSVRIPAMCNGIYGFKPSDGRLPFGGQATGQPEGKLRVGLKAVAGLLARSIPDIETVMRELIPRAELFGSDCIPGKWQSETPSLPEHVSQKRLTVGVLRSDGLIVPLPPVANVLDEVAQILRRTAGVDVVEVPTPPLMSKCQAAANRLMDVDGSGPILDLLAQTSEPLMPYLQGKMVRRPPITVEQLFALQAHRTELENAMKQIWTTKDGRKVDAIILPVAPHPVPEIDRWGGVSYTSTFVLCDYPAGTIPVRDVTEADLEQEFDASTKQPLSRSDAINRKLWDKSTVDRRVYLNSSLSIQVITPRLHEYDLCQAMGVIDEALRKNGQMQNMPTPKL